MSEADQKTVTVVIAGRPYPLRVRADEEAAIRKIVKEVNDQINQFQLTYQDRDKQDCLSMTVLTYAVDVYKARQATAQPSELSVTEMEDRLTSMETLIDKLMG